MKKNALKLITISVLLSSCSFFSPEYEQPKVETPTKWWQKDITQTEETSNDIKHERWNLPEYAWWRGFNDAKLNNLITVALKENNQLQVAIGNIKQAQTEIEKANYAWLPTASIGGGGFIAQTFDSGVSNPIGREFLPQGGGTYGGSLVGVVPSYTINLVREIKIGEIARLSKGIQTELKNATRLSIINQISISYFSLVTAKSQLTLQKKKVQQYEQILYLTKKQHEFGQTSPITEKVTEQLLESEKAKIATINNDINHFQNVLRILLGKNPGNITTGETIEELNVNQKIPVNLPSEVLEDRPDIALAEYKLRTANSNIGLARSQFFPSIDLTGAFGNATLALAQLATMNAGVWAGEALAAVPVFNLSILADSEKAKAQFYQGYYEYINTLQKAFQDVDDSLYERTASKKAFDNNVNSLSSAKSIDTIYQKKYEKGAASRLEYIMTNINVTSKEMEVNQAKLKTLISISNLYQSLGSGYNVDNYSTAHKDNPAWDK